MISGILTLSLLTQLSACGTIFYPDRRGQISGQVDPVVVAADAIGILFFVIPGLIALAIDFGTGAIYLPGGRHASIDPALLKPLVGADGLVDARALERLLEQQTGLHVHLDDPRLIQRSASAEQLASLSLIPAA